jgi:hypothetical protein
MRLGSDLIIQLLKMHQSLLNRINKYNIKNALKCFIKKQFHNIS